MQTEFYHGTTKKLITVFAEMFREIEIKTADNRTIKVPIHYSDKSKFIEILTKQPDPQDFQQDVAMPVMGFELESLNFATERNTNVLTKMKKPSNTDGTRDFIYNRVPYDLHFNLFVAVNRTEDGFRIIEQILPYFAPELTVTINDSDLFGSETNITTNIQSVSWTKEYEGTFDDKMILTWELQFQMKAYMYSDTRRLQHIQRIMLDITDLDIDTKYETLVADYDIDSILQNIVTTYGD